MIVYDQQTEGMYMKNNNLLIAAVLPIVYGAYKFYTDKTFKEKVTSNLDKIYQSVDNGAQKLKRRAGHAEIELKSFFNETYDELKLTDEQIEDIHDILTTKTSGVVGRVKKLLNEEQKKIYESSLHALKK